MFYKRLVAITAAPAAAAIAATTSAEAAASAAAAEAAASAAATTTAAAATSAAAAEAAASAAAATIFSAGFRFTNSQISSVNLGAVQFIDSILTGVIVGHFDKAKSTRISAELILDDIHCRDFAKSGKCLT